jgi:predicted aspartyl protease
MAPAGTARKRCPDLEVNLVPSIACNTIRTGPGGRSMKVRAAIAGAILAAAAAHGEGTGCQRYRLASLNITLDQAGRPLIPTKVDGVDLPLLVDTGGIDSELTSQTADRLKLPKELLEVEARVYNVYGGYAKYRTTADTFSIGVMSGNHWPFIVSAQDDPGFGDGLEAGGILGPDVMQRYDIEFDFAAGKFNIFTHDDCPGRVVYWTQQPYAAIPFRMDDGFHITASATLDGKDVDVIVDSGASSTVMSSMSAEELGVDLTKLGEGGKAPFKVLDLNGLAVNAPEIVIMPEKNGALHNFSSSRPSLILGDTVLRRLHIYVAYREKVLYVTPAEAR